MKASGILKYSPPLLGDGETNWWLILHCNDFELGRYYRNLYQSYHNNCRKLQVPGWKDHISIVRNEVPVFKEFWYRFEGSVVEFDYLPTVIDNGNHFWLEVECEFFCLIRKQLGLSEYPEYKFHLTIGNSKIQ